MPEYYGNMKVPYPFGTGKYSVRYARTNPIWSSDGLDYEVRAFFNNKQEALNYALSEAHLLSPKFYSNVYVKDSHDEVIKRFGTHDEHGKCSLCGSKVK